MAEPAHKLPLPKRDLTAAERNRRYRERKAAGLRVLRGALAVDEDSIARLVQTELISAHCAERDVDLLEAISHLLDDLAEAAE